MIKKLIVIFIAGVLFFISYQIRIGFLETKDYNNPSDAAEYQGAVAGALAFYSLIFDLLSGKGITQSTQIIKDHIIGALNTHGVPLYLTYLALLRRFNLDVQTMALIINSLFVVSLFLTARLFLSTGIAFLVGLAAALYTPLFTFIFSSMPENFTSIAIPSLTILASLLITRSKKVASFLIVGFLLALIGFSRHVFTFYGFFFILIWFLTSQKPGKVCLIALISGYIIPTIIWLSLVRWSGTDPYSQNAIPCVLYQAHNLKNDGWAGDCAKLSWGKLFNQIVLKQNPFSLILLRLERIPRFLRNPANSYTTSFPFSRPTLMTLHTFLLFLAAWGLRVALKNKFLALLTSALIWNTLFVTSYFIEEVRLQLPTTGIIILLAGAGLKEFLQLLQNKKTKLVIIAISGLVVFWFSMRSYLLGIEFLLVPTIHDSRVWKICHLLIATGVMILATKKLKFVDQKTKLIFNHRWAKKIYSLIPFIIFILVLIPQLNSRIWHQWQAPLAPGERIEQTISFSSSQLEKLFKRKGYLLIDIQDPNAAASLSVSLNDTLLPQRLPMKEFHSPVDLQAIRQWQPNWPRLGYGKVEDEMRMAPAWPNMHQWLIIPLSGKKLQPKNIVVIQNEKYLTSQLPLIFGDFPPFGTKDFYEGPTAKLFQGQHTHHKYQIDGDFRLTERQKLLSLTNTSRLFLSNGEEYQNDLSKIVGRQLGRYRIFFLFPYTQGDPINIF